jgi:quercetin dioxygenase-like cupin family protein
MGMTQRMPKIAMPGTGPTYAVVGDHYTFLATSEDTDGRYAFFEAAVYPGGGPPPHLHRREEEGFYVLEGEVAFYVNGNRQVAGPGTMLNLPVGVLHWFKNETDRPAKMLIWVAPGGIEKMFQEVGSFVADRSAPPPPPAGGLLIPKNYDPIPAGIIYNWGMHGKASSVGKGSAMIVKRVLLLVAVLAMLALSWTSAQAGVRVGVGIGVPVYRPYPYAYRYGYPYRYAYPYRAYYPYPYRMYGPFGKNCNTGLFE